MLKIGNMLKMFTRYLNIKKEEKQLPCISIQPFLIAPIYHFSNNLKDDTSKLIKIEGNDISLKFFIDYNLSETNTKEIIELEYDLKNTTVTLEKYYNDSSNEEENWIFQEYIQLPISGGDERRNNFGFIISDQLNMDTTKYDFDEKGMQLIYIFSDFNKKLRNESDLKKLVENFRLFLGLSNNSDWEKFKFQFTVIIKKKNTLERGEYKIKSSMFQLNFNEYELELTII